MKRETIATEKTKKIINQCIYCGAKDDLEDEHGIPQSLNGHFLLVNGSCRDCATITGKFEGNYTRHSLLAARTALNMMSKRPKRKRPSEFPMTIVKGKKEETINVPVAEHVSQIPLLELGPPLKHPNRFHQKGMAPGRMGIVMFNFRSSEHIKYLVEKYEADEIKVTAKMFPLDFLKMIAKIAYCFAVWRYGLHNIEKAFVIPSILGKSNDLLNWVGSDGKQSIYHETIHLDTTHMVTCGVWNNRVIEVRIKLFKQAETPEYIVMVGTLKKSHYEFLNSHGFI
jgi:hypothetical protein